NQLTGALPDAPLAGQWFEAQFRMLVENAYPAIEGDGSGGPAATTAPSVPTGLTAEATTTSSASVSWAASTDDRGVTGYTVLVDGAAVGTTATTSFTVTGLDAGTSYAVSVQPESLQTPRLSVLEQASARDAYQLWAWVRLLPGVTMPSFADPSIGSEAVAPDDSSLLVTPTDAVA
ncbi:fibronectin type III domain-containing protein, partial [Streptomyces sp. SID13726]|uniref:fibronectin type III domain-containing protein n=1 Tax=Streptomyces sp. SID13726 TaxID=2706058 RepID=UPI0013BC0AAB